MKRSLLILAAVLAIVIGGGVIWNQLRQLNPAGTAPQNSTPTATNTTPSAPPVAHATLVPHLNQMMYKHVLAQKVEDLVQVALYQDAESVAANELTLPRAALPLLQEQLDEKKIAPGAAKSIKDALDADKTRVAQAMAQKKRLDWFYNNTLAVFDKLHPNNPPWRQPSRSAIGAAVRRWARDPGLSGDENINMWWQTTEADKRGGDDALSSYVHAMIVGEYEGDQGEILRSITRAEDSMEKDAYPAYFQAETALAMAIDISNKKNRSDSDQTDIDRLIQRAESLFPKIISDPDLPEIALIDFFKLTADASQQIYFDRRQLPAQLFDELDASKVPHNYILTVQGAFNLSYASQTSASDSNGDISTRRLTKARTALEKAWALDHSDVYAATLMIDVIIAQAGDRDQMELWFKRAIDADPEHIQAYQAKLQYLEELSPDTYALALDFARSAAAASPPDSQVHLLAVRTYMDIAGYNGAEDRARLRQEYFRHNTAAWTDIHQAYMDYLPFHPESHHARLRYAQLAGYCGQWDEANRIFKELGPEVYDSSVFYMIRDQNQFAERAAREALHPSTMP